jgi:SAM-dependent methyltransferase
MSGGADGHEHARPRYLTAKQSVDDRARDRRVRDRLLAALPEHPRVGEAGCGTGATIPTLHEWGVTPGSYRGFDTDPGIVAFARWLRPRVRRRRGLPAGTPVTFDVGDALTALPETAPDGRLDLVVAQSFLDLVPLDHALDSFDRAVGGDGLVYAPLTFDSESIFLPEHPADERVVKAFHAAIDDTPGRDSRAGRHLLDRLREREARVEAVAASDWVIRPSSGEYPADERYFLACILGFVADALEDVEGGNAWLERRRRQLRTGELTYVAHGYDVLWQPAAEVSDR